MKKSILLLSSALVLIFSGCSTKKVFEPTEVGDDWSKYGDASEMIVDISSDAALLEDKRVLTKDAELDVVVEAPYRILSNSDGWIVSSTIDGKLRLQLIADKNSVEDFELHKTVATASVKNDI